MKMSSELLYQMEVSWNPCDVIFFTPAGARSRSSGKKLVEMEKVLIGISRIFMNLWKIPEPAITELSFSPVWLEAKASPENHLFHPDGCPFTNRK